MGKDKKPKDGAKAESNSKSAKAGLRFPVSRVNRHLREGSRSKRVSGSAPVFLSAVLELVASELFDAAGAAAEAAARKRVNPNDLLQSLRKNRELRMLFKECGTFRGDRIDGVSEAVNTATGASSRTMRSTSPTRTSLGTSQHRGEYIRPFPRTHRTTTNAASLCAASRGRPKRTPSAATLASAAAR